MYINYNRSSRQGLPCTNTNEEPIHCFVNNKNKNLRTKTKVMKSDKRKRKKNEKKPDAIQKKGKDVGFKKNIAKTDNEDCIDVETVPDEEPSNFNETFNGSKTRSNSIIFQLSKLKM